MISDGVGRYRPEHDVNCSPMARSLMFQFFSIKQSDRVEVCGAPGSELCRLHGQ